MGWFALAVIGGFILFWAWRVYAQSNILHVVAAAACGVVALAFWAITTSDCWSLNHPEGLLLGGCWSQIGDKIGSGRVARLVLGLVLGTGAAYVIEQRHIDLREARLYGGGQTSNSSSWGVADWTAVLSIALGITLLAVFAPFVEGWLPRINSVKTAAIEFQVRGEATHKVAVADSAETLVSSYSYGILKEYPGRMQDDIQYLEIIEANEFARRIEQEPSNKDYLQSQLNHVKSRVERTKHLSRVFNGMLAPIGRCLAALQSGGVSIERIRQTLAPAVDAFERTVFLPVDDPNYDDRYRDFWRNALELPGHLSTLRISATDRCADLSSHYIENSWLWLLDEKEAYPHLADYRDFPYLYAISAALMQFLKDEDIALSILDRHRDAGTGDYTYLKLLAYLSYFQGRLTHKVIEPLQEWHATIFNHQQRIANHCDVMGGCDTQTNERLKKLARRERSAELVAMNNFSFYVSEDLARDMRAATPFAATAEDYARKLKAAIDAGDPAVGESGDDFIDTYLYTMTVIEARRDAPDPEKLKKITEDLAALVERLEDQSNRTSDPFAIAALRATRTHYAAARDLIAQ